MCSPGDHSTGMTFYRPEDGKWWWTPTAFEDFFTAPKGYEKELAARIKFYDNMKVTFNASKQRWEARYKPQA
jgi:hypothetical protein